MNSAPEKLSFPSLRSKMKCDPEGYESELVLVYSQFKSSVELFEQQASLRFSSIVGIGSDPSVAKDLSDRAMFLAHVTPFFPKQLMEFPKQLADFLNSSATSLPSALRCHTAQALMLLINRKMVGIEENLTLFMKLQTLGDRALRKLAYSHVIHSIRRMNHKHKNELKNRALQKILFTMLQQEDEAIAIRSLITLCELYRRKVWFDERTASAICIACFHSSPRIMIAALSFLLNYEKFEDGEDDSDEKSSEDDMISQTSQAALSKELSRQVHRKIFASKKKKKAKLQRVNRSIRRQLRSSLEKSSSSYSPLDHLKDAQGFVEKLLSRLQACNERFEVKMMMLRVIARTIELHRLILLNFYPFLQKYVQPHQRDIKNLLVAAIQACHDKVPPDAIEPLFRQIVNQFVHDRSRTEAIVVGLNAVIHICERMPLLMTEDLLQELASYKKSHEKAVSGAARSLIALFQMICPSFLVKKDRGRPTNPEARPKAYGEGLVACDIPGVELLQQDDDGNNDSGYGDGNGNDTGDENSEPIASVFRDDLDQMVDSSDGENWISCDVNSVAEVDFNNFSHDDESGSNSREKELEIDEEDEVSDEEQDAKHNKESISDEIAETGSMDAGTSPRNFTPKKRKRSDFDQQLLTCDSSLRALKKLSGKGVGKPLGSTDGILSNEDFERIKELQAKKAAKDALTQHGLLRNGSALKILNTEELSTKRVNPAEFEVHIKIKVSKDERRASARAGREDRGKYQARAAVKQNKTGGSSNRQKEHKKDMPLAAKRAKVAKTRVDKRKKNQRSGKQFRGRKAWK